MDPEDEQSLEERLRAQSTSSTTNKTSLTNRVTTTTTNSVRTNRNAFKDEKIETHTDKNGVCYRIGDHVYLETNKQAEPYSIACILDFRLTRKDNVMLEVRWYYRPAEIPPNLYHLLIEDRYHENQGNNQTSPSSSSSSIKEKQTKDSGIIEDPNIIGRELFVSEIKEFYPAAHIKGRCRVAHYQDIEEARAFKPDPDTFFYILTYNPEARRLANTQGEIRVGPSHQAKLPLFKPSISSSISSLHSTNNNNHNDEICSLREEPLWKNKTSDVDLSMYLQAARSIAAFAGMCDRGLPEDMYEVAQRDDTTINALAVLHNHDYDCKRAIQALVKCPIPKGIDRKWSDDDQKKFIKGLRQYGKNFYRIRKEHLPHKETGDLVEFYYLWKKTPQAQSSRPRRRPRPCSTTAAINLSTTPTPAKQQRNGSNKNTIKEEPENNTGSDNDDGTTTTTTTTTDIENRFDETIHSTMCRHCQTTSSKDLQPGGRDSQLLCYDCRMFFKKYGEMPTINQEPPPYLFKPLNDTSSSSVSKRKRNKLRQSPPSADEIKSISSSSSSTRSSKKKTRINEQMSTTTTTTIVKEEEEEGGEESNEQSNAIVTKIDEQENEKPSTETSESTSGFLIKTEETTILSTTENSNTDLNNNKSTLIQPLPSLILTPTPCKQEAKSPSSSHLLMNGSGVGGAKVQNKILFDHTKQNLNNNNNSMLSPSSMIKSESISNSGNDFDRIYHHPTLLSSLSSSIDHHHQHHHSPSLLSSPCSAFSRTSRPSITTGSSLLMHSPDQRRSIKEEFDSISPHQNRSHSNSTQNSNSHKSNHHHHHHHHHHHPTILSGDVTPTATGPPPSLLAPLSSSLNESKDAIDSLPIAEMNEDDNVSDSASNVDVELLRDDGPPPLVCEREYYNKSQGIVLLQVCDRAMSQNSCARTDIVLKRGSRARRKQQQQQQQQHPVASSESHESPLPSLPPPSSTSNAMMMMGIKQEERNLSKLSFNMDKVQSMLHSPGPSPFASLNPHQDGLLMNRNSSLYHPLPLHALAGGPKPSPLGTGGGPPMGFGSPFGPSLHDTNALRHLDALGLRPMNPATAAAAAAAAAQLFATHPHFGAGVGRPGPGGLDPATAALFLDPRYRSMMPPFGSGSPSPIIPPPSSSNTSPSSGGSGGTHSHAHIHSHSHTHLHLGNSNDSTLSSNNNNGPPLPLPPPPPPMMNFHNPLSGLSHGGPMTHGPGQPPPPSPSSMASFEAMHNLTRDRELMAFMMANSGRFDPMALALASSLQMPRHEDLARMNARERPMREHNENEFRRLTMDVERQQQHRFQFHH